MVLPLGFVCARLVGEPVSVVTRNLCRLDVQASQLPVSASLLQNERHGLWSLIRTRLDGVDRIISGRQVWYHENCAVRGLPLGSEHPAQKLGSLHRRRSFDLEHIGRPWVAGLSRQVRLAILNGVLDPGEI